MARVVRLPSDSLKHLGLHRPATEDLILTKMMRIDPQDREDIGFLLKQADLSEERLKHALETAIIPAVSEIKKAFEENKKWLRQFCSF